MIAHKISTNLIEPLTRGPSTSKTTQVSNLQNYIQDLLGETHHTFLQGSYANDTAITDINDVDIVAIRKTTYSGIFSPHRCESCIDWNSIFNELESTLRGQKKYSWAVTRGDKCIKVRGAFDADIVPAVKVDHDHTQDPIVIYSHKTASERKNFPKTYYENAVTKHKATNQLYKPTVRLFKNWIKNQIDDSDVISSFKIQALIYNVPSNMFNSDMAVNFILVGAEILKLLQANAFGAVPPIMSVCGAEDINVGWDRTKRNSFISKLAGSILDANAAVKTLLAQDAETYWKRAFNL